MTESTRRTSKWPTLALDRPRRVIYDMNALMELTERMELDFDELAVVFGRQVPVRDAAGEPVLDATGEPETKFKMPTVRHIRTLVTCGLLADDPALTEEIVGALVTPDKLGETFAACSKALAEAISGGDDADGPQEGLAMERPLPRPRRRTASPASAPSPAETSAAPRTSSAA